MQDNELNLKVLVALRRIMRAVDLHSKKLEREYRLTGPQLIILHEIIKTESITIGGLAKAVNLSNATITGIIDRLEKRGLVVRIRSSDDRRQVLIKTTAAGTKTLKSAPSPLQEEFVNRFNNLNSNDQESVLAALERVAEMMNAEHLEVAPMLSAQSLPEGGRERPHIKESD